MPSLLSSGGRLARRPSFRLAALAASLALAPALPAAVVDFSDVNLGKPPAQDGPGGVYYNGHDEVGQWSSGGVSFSNYYDDSFGAYWEGFAYSTTSDTVTIGPGNQYSAFATTGSGTYAIAYAGYVEPTTISFASGVAPLSIDLTNTTYAALDMLNGGLFGSKKFGGETGDDEDYFYVTLTGYDAHGNETDTVTFYLADFRFENNALDYIVSDWTTVDLTSLGSDVWSIKLDFYSSDNGDWGINTPTYVALDNLVYTAIPEPASAATLAGVALLGFAALRRRVRV